MVIGLVRDTFGDSLDRVPPFYLIVHLNNNFTEITINLSRDKRERYLSYIHTWYVHGCFAFIFFSFGQ